MRNPFATVAVIFGLIACREETKSVWTPRAADVTNSNERQFIESVVDELQAYSKGKNLGYDFRAVPIRVVEDFSYPFDDAEVGGACYPGENKFIEIKRPVLRNFEEAWNIVVHELGHCVLERTHDDETMRGGGREIAVRRGGQTYSSIDLTVSIMSSRGNRMAPRKYYMEQLFGGPRVTDVDVLRRAYPNDVIPASRSAAY